MTNWISSTNRFDLPHRNLPVLISHPFLRRTPNTLFGVVWKVGQRVQSDVCAHPSDTLATSGAHAATSNRIERQRGGDSLIRRRRIAQIPGFPA
jgi:hypothetical protein